MKKCVSFVLAVLLLITLTACKQEKDPTVTLGQTHSDYEGLSMGTVKGTWEAGEIKLDVSFCNDTEYVVTYGEQFEVEREADGQWVRCQVIENRFFHEVAYLLEAGEAKEKTYDLTDHFVISEPGTYRFRTACFVDEQNDLSKRTTCQLWAEFTVTD